MRSERRRRLEPPTAALGAGLSDELRNLTDAGLTASDAPRLKPRDDDVQRNVPMVHALQAGQANAVAAVILEVVGEGDGHGRKVLHHPRAVRVCERRNRARCGAKCLILLGWRVIKSQLLYQLSYTPITVTP